MINGKELPTNPTFAFPIAKGVTLLDTDAGGIYIPQHFYRQYVQDSVHNWGFPDWVCEQLDGGPDMEGYWDAWDDVLSRVYTDAVGKECWVLQDGDLWLLCPDRMSDEEKNNFGFEE